MSTIPTQRIYEGYLCLRVFFVRRVGYFQYCGMEGGTPCRYRQIICNIPPLWDFLISPDFHRVGGFEDRYSLSFVPVLSYVYVNTLFQRGYFYVGLRGAGWYFLPENPTFFVRRNRKIPHTQHTTKIKHANHGDVRHCLFCRPWLSSARSSAAPRLPMSLMQAPCARVRAHCDRSPCLGRQNGTHR